MGRPSASGSTLVTGARAAKRPGTAVGRKRRQGTSTPTGLAGKLMRPARLAGVLASFAPRRSSGMASSKRRPNAPSGTIAPRCAVLTSGKRRIKNRTGKTRPGISRRSVRPVDGADIRARSCRRRWPLPVRDRWLSGIRKPYPAIRGLPWRPVENRSRRRRCSSTFPRPRCGCKGVERSRCAGASSRSKTSRSKTNPLDRANRRHRSVQQVTSITVDGRLRSVELMTRLVRTPYPRR